jgi:hypothetical protein
LSPHEGLEGASPHDDAFLLSSRDNNVDEDRPIGLPSTCGEEDDWLDTSPQEGLRDSPPHVGLEDVAPPQFSDCIFPSLTREVEDD